MSKSGELRGFWRTVAVLISVCNAVAALALAGMIVVTTLDVILRQFGFPIKGAYDIVRVCGATALGCALPATTASKGHIAVEYFFQRLKRRGRRIVDTLVHGTLLIVFCIAAWQSILFGQTFLRTGEVSLTLQLPLFWVPWLLAVGCILAGLVSLWHLLHPGREMLKP